MEQQPQDFQTMSHSPASRGTRRVSQTLLKGLAQSISKAGLILCSPLPLSPKLLLYPAVVAGKKQENGVAKERFPNSGQEAGTSPDEAAESLS